MSEVSLENLIGYMDSSEDFYDLEDPIDDKTPIGDPIEPELDPYEDPITPEPKKEEPTKPSPEPVKGEEDDNLVDKDTSSTYTEYFNILKENGLLYVEDDFQFEDNAEGLEKAIEQTKKNLHTAIAQSLWEKLPEDFKPLLQYALEGGNDVSKFLETFKTKDLETIEIEGNLENQRYVLKEYFKRTTKYDDSRIDKMVDRIYMLGDMENEAQTALQDLKELDTKARQELVDEQKRLREEEEISQKTFRTNIATTIDQISYIEGPRKNKVKSFLFNPIKLGEDIDTQFNRTLRNISTNPEHLIQLANILMDYDDKKGITLDWVQRKADSQATKTIKEKLEEAASNTKTKVTGATSKIQQGDFDWDMFLKQN